MKGDMEFLVRLAKRANQLETVDAWITSPEIPPFDITCMIPESIDFHCCGGIIDWCSEKTKLEPDNVKSAIWWHFSSISVRESECVDRMYVERSERERTSTHAEILTPYVQEYAAMKLAWMVRSKKTRLIQQTLEF